MPPRSIRRIQPSLEAFKEFKVQTSGMGAEYGRTGGGIFNFVMKSGDNRSENVRRPSHPGVRAKNLENPGCSPRASLTTPQPSAASFGQPYLAFSDPGYFNAQRIAVADPRLLTGRHVTAPFICLHRR